MRTTLSSFLLLAFLLLPCTSGQHTTFKGDNTNSNSNSFCLPRTGFTALFIGQDLKSIVNYTEAFNSSSFGYMTYTALHSPSGNLTGLSSAIDYGTGIEFYDGILKYFQKHKLSIPNINLGLHLVDTLSEITSGLLNKHIDDLARFVLYTAHSTCYLRIGYEFDSKSNHYDTKEYKQAFRIIVKRFRALQVSNVAFVWHASGFKPRHHLELMDWFPGEEFVDICAVSLFQQPFDSCSYGGEGTSSICEMTHVHNVLKQCQELDLPLMIAESTPFGGIVEEVAKENEAGFRGHSWPNWFHPVLTLIESYDIKYWSYINCDWDSFPVYQREHSPGIMWGDSSVQNTFKMFSLLFIFIHSSIFDACFAAFLLCYLFIYYRLSKYSSIVGTKRVI